MTKSERDLIQGRVYRSVLAEVSEPALKRARQPRRPFIAASMIEGAELAAVRAMTLSIRTARVAVRETA